MTHPNAHFHLQLLQKKNEAVSLVSRGGGLRRCGVARLSAVAQGPLNDAGRSGRHVNGCLRQGAAPPFPHRIRALAADMFSSVAVTDCRSSLTGKKHCLCCASGRLKIVWYETDGGGFVMGSAGDAWDANKWWCRSFFPWFCGWCQSCKLC